MQPTRVQGQHLVQFKHEPPTRKPSQYVTVAPTSLLDLIPVGHLSSDYPIAHPDYSEDGYSEMVLHFEDPRTAVRRSSGDVARSSRLVTSTPGGITGWAMVLFSVVTSLRSLPQFRSLPRPNCCYSLSPSRSVSGVDLQGSRLTAVSSAQTAQTRGARPPEALT